MRYLAILPLLAIVQLSFGQACPMPASLDQLKPERCGIRHVKSTPDQIQVILEFEKRARILTPDNPNDVKGQQYNLTGLYYLQYDLQGRLLDERRVFVQTGNVPQRGMIFGLNGQRGMTLESDVALISMEEYRNTPTVQPLRIKTKVEQELAGEGIYFDTELDIDNLGQMTSLQILKTRRQDAKEEPIMLSRRRAALEMYDSLASKKKYWTSLYLPSTDQREGYTLAMLNRYDRELSKEVSDKRLRLLSLDSVGQVVGEFDFEFEVPMKVIHRAEKYGYARGFAPELEKQIWVFSPNVPTTVTTQLGQYQYFCFDKHANLLFSTQVVSKFDVFNAVHEIWTDKGVIYMSSGQHGMVTCFIDPVTGKYQVYDTGDQLRELQSLYAARTRNGSHNLSIALHEEPKYFDDGTMLVILQVEEGTGLGASMTIDLSNSSKINHGLVVLHLSQEGKMLASKYYQRPKNADPGAVVEVGPVQRNDDGAIWFYATEKTTDGSYPVLYGIRHGAVRIVKNEGPISLNYIYFDADQGIVSYFGEKRDPFDSRSRNRTVEVLVAN